MYETPVGSLGREAPLEKRMATQSSILAWRILWTEEPVRLLSMGSQRVRHDWATNTFNLAIIRSMISNEVHIKPPPWSILKWPTFFVKWFIIIICTIFLPLALPTSEPLPSISFYSVRINSAHWHGHKRASVKSGLCPISPSPPSS